MPTPPTFLDELSNVKLFGFPVIYILIFLIVVIFWIWKRKPKQQIFKAIDLRKKTKENIRKIFVLTEEKTGAGLSLMIGATRSGYIMKAIRLNWAETQKTEENINANTELEKIKAEVKLKPTEEKKIYYKFYGFKVCGKSIIKQIIARISDFLGLSFGIRYYIVDDSLVKIQENSVNINPYVNPTYFLDIIVFSRATREFVEDNAYKLSRELELNELVNYLPKQTYLETNQSKQTEQLKIMEDMLSKRKKQGYEDLIKE